MAKLLDASGTTDDRWTLIDGDAPVTVAGPALYPLAHWLTHRHTLGPDSGVWVDADADPGPLADVIDEVPLIAIRFGAFTDGRGLSLAVLLRNRYAYRGELRAIGAVHEDLVHYMHRCGFDSYVLGEDRDLEVARRGIEAPREAYQGSVRHPAPAFRRAARS